MSNISQEILKKETEKSFTRSMEAFIELSNDENFVKVVEKHNVTLLNLASSMISQMFATSGISLKQDKEVFETVDQFIDKISNITNLHPSDCCLLISKIITDMLMQISTLITLESLEEKNN